MDPERWRRIRALVEAAFELSPAARARFLDDACGEDAELRSAVDALLASDEAPTGALDPPDRESVRRRFASPHGASGDDLGEFVVEAELGAGGMGVVYAARQKQPPRRVALKMLRAGATSPEALRRFRLEAEVLGRLLHPGIAQIYSAGVHREGDREIPWFAMELVEDARPVTVYAREQRLSPDERLELFRAICDAVHLGHQKGVIHRDLKPGNILVGADGRPKIIDFGIARIVGADQTRVTSERTTDGVLGTLQAMSPEQAAGERDLDVRSDVYSLGVVLFELLTGGTPHDLHGLPVHEAARAIVQDEPRRPRALAPDLPEDLEIVMLKALAKEQHRRYSSVGELAADLARYRDHLPIEARRPSTAYSLALFARRHRSLVGVSTAFLLSLAIALVWSVHAAREARAAERVAERERKTADRLRGEEAVARQRSDELFRRSLDANVRFVRDFVGRVQQLPGSTRIAHDMTAAAAEHLEFLAASAGEPGPALDALARALVELGDVQGAYFKPSLGDEDLAGRSYARALEIAEELERAAPGSPESLELLAWCRGNAGVWRLGRGEVDAAAALFESELASLDRARAAGSLRDLRPRIASAMQYLGTVDGLRGEHAAALDRFRGSRALYAELAAESPEDVALATNHATAVGRCGAARFRLGDDGGLDDLLRECELLEDALARDPAHAPAQWLSAETRLILCQLNTERGDLDAAREHGEHALAILEVLAELDPASVKYRRLLGHVAFNLGAVEESAAAAASSPDDALERSSAAAGWYERSLELISALADENALPPQERDHPRRIAERLDGVRQPSAPAEE